MKIIHLVSYFQPQMGYQEYYLAKEHQKMGHEVIVVTSDRYFPFPDYAQTTMPILGKRILTSGTFTEHGITVIRLPVLFEKSARVWLKRLGATLWQLHADIIISHGMYNFSSIRLSFKNMPANTKLIFDDHMTRNLVRKGLVSNISYLFFRVFFSKRIEKKAWKIIGVYQNTVDLLVNKMGFSKNKVSWISMGSDTSQFYSDQNMRQQFRHQYQINKEQVIIYTGKLNESKMVHLLIEVLNDTEFDGISKCLLVVGGIAPSYNEVWQKALASARFRILYHAPVKGHDLQQWFNAADIAAWPAHTTISSLDAAACGCAIICPDYIAERVANRNGIAIKEGDRKTLKDALLAMLTQPDLLNKMRQNSREYIQTKLNWRMLAAHFIQEV